MRFLEDECTGPAVARWLREQKHEVFSVYEEARGLDDDAIIQKAFDENWILITNDKDFGEKVYRERRPHWDVVFLRLEDERSAKKLMSSGACSKAIPTDWPTILSWLRRGRSALHGRSLKEEFHRLNEPLSSAAFLADERAMELI